MSPRRSLRARAALINASSPAPSNAMSRPRRITGGSPSSPSVTVSRSTPNSPEESAKSIRLTVKMPSSKLREVTTGGAKQRPHNIFAEAEIMTGPRNSRNKRKIVEVDTDDEMDEEDENDYEEGADQDASDQDDDVDADGDVDMDDESPVPVSKKQAAAKPALTVTPAAETRVRNIDAKNMELDDDDDDDDEELSELDSDAEGEDDDEVNLPAPLSAAEGGTEDQDLEEGDEEDESESELGTPATGSRASTPNGKMTKRQRGRVDLGGDFLQLPMEPQVKKHLTAEEHAMRRAEMARRRKNLSEKRNEEEKMDTINKLLKKQAPKRRGKISAAETAGEATPRNAQATPESDKPTPTMTRWVSSRESCRVGVPNEWIGVPAGRVLGNGSGSQIPQAGGSGKLVEEV
ncbi:hypothetical protein FQN54_004145 [Arachnomyces sp. PD_36]|nr:hypothetical protein FQN54_004145 [Arachnomyces sp. PD_36]